MKNILKYTFVVTLNLGLLAPMHAQAQAPTGTQACVAVVNNASARAHASTCGPVSQGTRAQEQAAALPSSVDQYVADSYEKRSKAWWKALERQLTLAVDMPYEQVSEVTLKNIIFFATHHSDKVKLDRVAPRLLEVYRERDAVGYRMMAVAALHAIGNEGSMQQLNQIVANETEGMVRNVTIAALNDHYGRR